MSGLVGTSSGLTWGGWYPSEQTSVRIRTCPYCGCLPHDAGVGACPDVQEIEYDNYGHVKRVVKRPR